MAKRAQWKLFIYTCFGGCATGVSASKACIRLWEENPADVKIACLPAVVIPWKIEEMLNSSEKRMLVDACGLRCGAKLFEREGMTVDRYLELASELGVRKTKQLPSYEMEEEVFSIIQKEAYNLLGKGLQSHEEGEKPGK